MEGKHYRCHKMESVEVILGQMMTMAHSTVSLKLDIHLRTKNVLISTSVKIMHAMQMQHVTCTNTSGSYSCSCDNGFR